MTFVLVADFLTFQRLPVPPHYTTTAVMSVPTTEGELFYLKCGVGATLRIALPRRLARRVATNQLSVNVPQCNGAMQSKAPVLNIPGDRQSIYLKKNVVYIPCLQL